MISGECNCGAIAFEADGELSDIFICHCSICRRFTGGNEMAVVLCRNDAFRWLRGEDRIASWKKSDADWQSWFCSTCGSTLPGTDSEEWTFIPAGIITNGSEKLRVAHHIWVGSKAAWDQIGDRGMQHWEAYEG